MNRHPHGRYSEKWRSSDQGPIIVLTLALKPARSPAAEGRCILRSSESFPRYPLLRTASRPTTKLGSAMPIPTLTRTALETVWSQSHRLTASERWYAVHTLPFAEPRAEGQLHRQGFRTFQPKRHKTVRHARRLSTIEAPFFPRYLFIVLDLGRHQWRSVNGTFGVSRLVTISLAAFCRAVPRRAAPCRVGRRISHRGAGEPPRSRYR
jgi:hypothetical protein